MISNKKIKNFICAATIGVAFILGIFLTSYSPNQSTINEPVKEENIKQFIINEEIKEDKNIKVSNSFDVSIPKYYKVEENKIDFQEIEKFYVEGVETLNTENCSNSFEENNAGKIDLNSEEINSNDTEDKEIEEKFLPNIIELDEFNETEEITEEIKTDLLETDNSIEANNFEEETIKEINISEQTTENNKINNEGFQFYTWEDVIVLAKMVWGEARGVPSLTTKDGRIISSKAQQAATIWCVLNRFDAGFAESIIGVVTAPNQFHGYKASFPATDEFIALAEDVLERWVAEKNGEENVGRTLGKDYLYFGGTDGYIHFRVKYKEYNNEWKWEIEDPYKKFSQE